MCLIHTPSCPDLQNQPVLVIEVPREFIHPTTSKRFLQNTKNDMQMKQKISTSRWSYIGQFLIIYTKTEQVFDFPSKMLSSPKTAILNCSFYFTSFICRYILQQDWIYPTTKFLPRSFLHILAILISTLKMLIGKILWRSAICATTRIILDHISTYSTVFQKRC